MKTVVFGGTFNPIHNGHLYISEEVRVQLDYDRFFFVPSNIPPHKNNNCSVTPGQRVEMLSLALEDSDLILNDCEINRGGLSYTIDTIDSIYRDYTVTGKIGLVIGDDLAVDFKKWYRWQDLLEKVDLVVVHRSEKEPIKMDYPHIYLDNIIFPTSSSMIRSRIAEGKAYRYLIPEKVYRYIYDNNLYKDLNV